MLAIIASGVLLIGCGVSRSTAQTGPVRAPRVTDKEPASPTTIVRFGGLTVTLKVTPMRAKAGSPVQFNLSANASHAPGALGYQLRFGDGTTTQNAVPQFCVARRRTPARQAWRLTHRYKTAGRYAVSASVYVNCTSDHATATVAVNIA